ncbi:hypothetical protein BU23DRAFT_167319 [Bimuria novae-zelandiae CBS 107.79]|uniref:Uncharacterized protein n=1 Tax=Bimuria novae-zelandiae CBS 107.79 TaxID=1447943 RepID=A0A6A5V567_9PLEO|nr:hypothetical protein BU23DRAFT_167319 [Bimuria novae-zelandiae CBS 107.79]
MCDQKAVGNLPRTRLRGEVGNYEQCSFGDRSFVGLFGVDVVTHGSHRSAEKSDLAQENMSAKKRKRSPDLATAEVCPKFARQCASPPQQSTDGSAKCRLLSVLEQYGLLVSIVSHFAPEDLFSLAATSKATYRAMFSGNQSITNILAQIPCSGRGVAIRRATHRRSSASTGPRCIQLDICGTENSLQSVVTRPCDTCSYTTCDECRIHCVFNSTIEPEEEPDDLPTYSGFVLLDPTDMGILTAAHLNLSSRTTISPYHDRGFLDTPWTADQPASLEEVEEIIDFPLGQWPLRVADSSTARHPSSVIRAFWEYTEERKLMLCEPCRKVSQVGEFHPNPCNCTLRERILDRWLCVECFQTESAEIRDKTRDQMLRRYRDSALSESYLRCSCGKQLGGPRVLICLWCKGTVTELLVPDG